MNPNRYQGRGGGPTGSIHRAGVSGGPPLMGQSDKKWGDTTSKAGEVSRIFVGNIDYKSTNCCDIEQRFSKYGIIKGIDINSNGFAFVQYDTIEEAQNACLNENGLEFKNRKSEVRLFDKSNHPVKGRPQHVRNRSRSPIPRKPSGGPTGTRHGSSILNTNQFDDLHGYPPPPPGQPIVGNDVEIIVVNREQWGYAEMIERRVRLETGIEYIDMLFLHSPSSLNLTLNDLFERRTLYAIVVSPVNEGHNSLTLHVLHKQTEHKNMPLEDALQLIAKDFQSISRVNSRMPAPPSPQPPQPPHPPLPLPPPSQPIPPYAGDNAYNPYNDSYSRSGFKELPNEPKSSMKLPEDISYLLKTVIQEDGPQFLSLQQIDSVIGYFTSERNRMASKAQTFQQSGSGPSLTQQQSLQQTDYDKQRATLLDNPHVQAALSSLLQIGALNTMNSSGPNLSVSIRSQPNSDVLSSQYGGQPSHQLLDRDNDVSNTPTLRHPLFGAELGSNKFQSGPIPGAPGGLVRYPLPQSYSQYGIKNEFS